MPLDINLLRDYKGGNPEEVKSWQRKRAGGTGDAAAAAAALVDEVVSADKAWRECLGEVENARKEINGLKDEIGKLYKAKKASEAGPLKARKESLEATLKEHESLLPGHAAHRDSKLSEIGNMVAVAASLLRPT